MGGVTVRSPAKINLVLSVGAPRPDGFHPLATVFQAVSLVDDVTATPREDGEFTVAVVGQFAGSVPVDDDNPDLYGGGYTTGNIIGIPKTAEHKEQGWALLNFLATSDKAQVMLSNGLRNVPTTESSAQSPDLKPDPKFETFLKIFGNEHTTTTPVTAAGSAYQELFNNFVNKWQAGRVDDLEAGLADVDKQIDAQLANAEGEQVP